MFLTLKWMDNLQQIKHEQNICHLFLIFNLTCCKFVALKEIISITLFKIITVSKPSTLLRVFLMGRSWCPTKERNWVGDLPASPEMWTYSFFWISPPLKNWFPPSLSWSQITYWKKVSLIAFRQILPKVWPMTCIFSYTILIYLKNLDLTKSLNTKQCPAGLSPRIIHQLSPFLLKMSLPLMLLCSTHHVWTVLLPLNLHWEPWGWSKTSYPFHYQMFHSFPIK